jgi:cysteine-rich repeat protein
MDAAAKRPPGPGSADHESTESGTSVAATMNVMRTTLLVPLLALHLALVSPSSATTADDICASAANPCVVTSMVPVSDGSVLDFGARDLSLKKRGKLNVGAGSMTIKAHNLTLEDGSFLQAIANSGPAGSISVETSGDITLQQGSVVDASGTPGGDVSLEAAGAVLIVGDLMANGTSGGDGGSVLATGATVTIPSSGDVMASGDGDGGGGDVELDSISSLSVVGTVDGSGGAGGGGSLRLATDGGSIAISGQLRFQSVGGGGDGGSVSIDGAGAVTLGGQLNLGGDGGGAGGGIGGDLEVDADGSLSLQADTIDVRGAPPDGDGGSASFSSGTDLAAASSVVVQLQARGSAGTGGIVDFTAGRNLNLPSLDASAGDQGAGGSLTASACGTLSLNAGRTVDLGGPTGDTTFTASGQMTIAGRLLAGQSNTLQFLTQGPPPILTGSDIVPPAVLEPVASVPGCTAPGCGNGTMDPGEECDDGNTVSCDGCSRTCKKETGFCGDGHLNPECEACDDGNQVDCDGCRHDCSRADKVCGDNIVECGEDGDLGAAVPCDADGLSATCKFERCGNGVTECNEQCDAGATGSTSCSSTCLSIKPPHCGDGTTQANEGEACDDGNAVDCDGCSHLCQFDGCGSGEIDLSCGEQCDDGNRRAGDGCSPTCQMEVCGNGVVDPGEACDDGNANDCDNCKNDCTAPTVACPICSAGATEPCIPCTDVADCDALRACGSALCSAGACTPTNPPNCDDGNPCTADSCDPARGCVHTPKTCEDGDACNGVSTCDPSSGACLPGTAPDCDDHDECTDDDRCVGAGEGFQCTTTPRMGAAMATCRLAAIDRLLSSATIKKSTRNKLSKLVKLVRKKLPAAGGSGKKAARALNQANNALLSLNRVVAKAGKKIPPDTAASLREAISKAAAAVASL